MRVAGWLRQVLDFCYPRVCAVCDGLGEDGSQLCPGCMERLAQLESAPACDRCAMPLAQPGAPCPHCLGDGALPVERIARLGVFNDPLRQLIHHIKYHGRWPLAEFLAERLVRHEPARRLLREVEVLVPLPLHPWRHMSRGFNQAELIARRIARRCRIKLAHPLLRLKNTPTQTRLHSRAERTANLRGAFGLLRPRAIRDKHVMLVDDVMTTGATLASAARTLLEAEPASLCAIVVAVADPRRRDFQSI